MLTHKNLSASLRRSRNAKNNRDIFLHENSPRQIWFGCKLTQLDKREEASSTQYEHEIYYKIRWTKADPVGRCDTFFRPRTVLTTFMLSKQTQKKVMGKREKYLFVQIQWQICYQPICSVSERYEKPSRWCQDEISSRKRNSTGEKLRKHMNKRNPFANWGFIYDS